MKVSVKQSLLREVKSIIRALEVEEKNVKERVQFYWERSNPDTECGSEDFAILNQHRTTQRLIKKEIKKFAMLAKELKG